MGDIELRLHSRSEETSNLFKKGNGHSWISITTPDGYTTSYGLWADNHSNVNLSRQQQGWDGSGTAIKQNIEYGFDKLKSSVSTSWKISDKQYRTFQDCLNNSETYHAAKNNCATWAAKVTQDVTGERVHNNSIVTPWRVKLEINRINAEKEIKSNYEKIDAIKSKDFLTKIDQKMLENYAGENETLNLELARTRTDITKADVYEKLFSLAPNKVLDKVIQKYTQQRSNEPEM
ncbi:hypothetical protein NIES4101_27580 (plasmid) [Calothrix sp. NIES-4101]|nr:hypothetical protein NIES4101_27580 [Calothrix sp. NIES-4101]